MKNNFFSKENKVNISVGRVAITIIMLVVVVLGGTFAWLTYQSRKSALVLTIGDIHETQIKLTPYEIRENMIPSNNESGGVYSDVTVTNGRSEDTTVTLFYKVGEGNTYTGDLNYKVVSSMVEGEFNPNNNVVSSGTFTPSEVGIDGNEIVFSTNIKGNTLSGKYNYYYRVYLWAPNDGDNSENQGQATNLELNAAIGSSSIMGTNQYKGTLIANFEYSAADNDAVKPDKNDGKTVTYQWYSINDLGNKIPLAIEGATSRTYTVQSGYVGYYMYVEAKIGDEIVYSAVTDEPVQPLTLDSVNLTIPQNLVYTSNNVSFNLTSDKSDGTVSVNYYSDSSCSTSISAPKNAGTYYVNGSVTAGNDKTTTLVGPGNKGKDYTSANASCSAFTIKPKTVSVTWSDKEGQSYVYDGTTVYTKVATTDTGITGETMSFTVTGGNKNAGEHNLTASCSTVTNSGCGNYKLSSNTTKVTVEKYSPSISTISTFTINAFDQKTVTPTVNSISACTYSLSETGGTNKTYSSSVSGSTVTYTGRGITSNVDSTIKFTPNDKNNCNEPTKQVKVNVNKVTPSSISLTSDTNNIYNGSVQTTGGTVSGLYGSSSIKDLQTNYTGDALSYKYTYYTDSSCSIKTTTANGASAEGGAPSDVNIKNSSVASYYVIATLNATNQFNTKASNCAEFKIDKYTPTLSFDPTGADGDPDHDQLEIPVNDTAKFTTTVNTIAKCGGILKATNSDQALVMTGEREITSGGATAVEIELQGSAVTDGDDITIKYTPSSTNNCNSVTVDDYTVRVVKRQPKLNLANKEVTYSGTTHTPGTVTTTYEFTAGNNTTVTGLTYEYVYYTNKSCSTKTATSTGATSAGGAPIDAGNYYVKAFYTTTDTSEYGSASSNCAKLTIKQKPLEVAWTSETSFVYNGSQQSPTASVVRCTDDKLHQGYESDAKSIQDETVSLKFTSRPTDVSGSTTATVACNAVSGGRGKCNNYKLTNATSHSFSITPYEIKIAPVTSVTVDAFATASVTPTVTVIDACKGTLSASGGSNEVVTVYTSSIYNNAVVTYKGHNYHDGGAVSTISYNTDNDNCIDASITTTVNVNKISASSADLAITLADDTNNIYSGSSQTINSTPVAKYKGTRITSGQKYNDVVFAAPSFDYKYYTGSGCSSANAITGSPTNAGDYSVKATLKSNTQFEQGSSACANFKINKYTPTISVSENPYNVTLDSEVSTAASVTTIASCEVKYSHTPTSSEYIELSTNPTTISNMTANSSFTLKIKGKKVTSSAVSGAVNLTATDTDNCSNATAQFNVNVLRKTPVISLTAKTATYNGGVISANAATATYNGANVTGLTYNYVYYTNSSCSTKTTTATGASAEGGAPKNAGTYYVKATSVQAADYFSASSSCVKHTINKKTATVSWNHVAGVEYVYSGTWPSWLVASVSTGITGETMTITYDKPVNVGTYDSVKATCSSVANSKCSNYTLSGDTAPSFTIGPKPVHINWSNLSFTYDGTEKIPSAVVEKCDEPKEHTDDEPKTDYDKDLLTVIDETMTVAVSGGQKNAGTYTATATCSSVSGGQASCSNYTFDNPTSSFTINKANCSCTINSVPKLEYPSNTSLVTGSTYGNITYSCTGDGALSVTADTNYLTVGTVGTTSTRLTAKKVNTSGVEVTVSRATGTNYNACSVKTNNSNTATTDNNVVINPSKYTISFNENGGYTGSSPTNITKTYGSSITLPTQTPKYYGYKFEGWNTKADGTGTTHAAGSSFTTEITANTTLYAKWSAQTDYLMGYTSAQTETSNFLRSSLKRNQISSITFVPNISSATGTITDASRDNNGSIKMWYGSANANGYYDVYIGSQYGITTLSDGAYLFSYLTNLSTINFVDDTYDIYLVDTSETTNMNDMFSSTKLTSLDLSHFDTSNVTNMSYMFQVASSLTSLDLSGWDTSNVTNMYCMFQATSSLTSLDLSGWDTSNVTNMSYMFMSSSLTNINLSHFDTSKVTNMYGMFGSMSSLTSLDLSGWDTSNVTNMGDMFEYSTLTSLDLSHFDTSKVTNMNSMFAYSNLTSLDLSGWDTSNVTNMSYMFQATLSLTSLDLSHFDTSKVTDMQYMFAYSNLTSLDLSGWDTSNVTNMNSMFDGLSKLSKITFGSKFKFVGTNGYLPIPDNTNFSTATGKWYRRSDWKMFTPAELANTSASSSIAGTYQAYPLEIVYHYGEESTGVTQYVGVANTASNSTITAASASSLGIDTINIKENLTNLGWSLDGWSTSSTGTGVSPTETYYLAGSTNSLDLSSTVIQNLIGNGSTLELYSIYKRNLEFYSGSPEAIHSGKYPQYLNPAGYDAMNNPKKYPYYTSITTPALTAISGYTAIGWQDSKGHIYTDGNGSVTFALFVDPLAKKELHGIYGVGADTDAKTSKAYFYSGDYSASSTPEEVTIYYYSYTGSCEVTTPDSGTAIDGWDFIGWRDDTDADGWETTPGNTATSCATKYYAVYASNIYYYYRKDPTADPLELTLTKFYNSGGVGKVITPPLSNVSMTDSDFTALGWRDDKDADVAELELPENTSDHVYKGVSATDARLTPTKWYTVYRKNVYFHLKNNNNLMSDSKLYYNAAGFYSLTLPEYNTSIDGYDFLGWLPEGASINDEPYQPGDNYTSYVDLFTAIYNTNNDISFNSGTNNSKTVNATQYYVSLPSALIELDEDDYYYFYVPDTTDANMASVTGYNTKEGWSLITDLTSVNSTKDISSSLASGLRVNSTIMNITYYAIYSRNVKFYYGVGEVHEGEGIQYYHSSDHYRTFEPTIADMKAPSGDFSFMYWLDINSDLPYLPEYINSGADAFYANYAMAVKFYSGINSTDYIIMGLNYNSSDVYSVEIPSAYIPISGYKFLGWLSDSVLPEDVLSSDSAAYLSENVISSNLLVLKEGDNKEGDNIYKGDSKNASLKNMLANTTAFYAIYDTKVDPVFESGMDTKELYDGDNNNDGDITDEGDTPPIQYYSSANYYAFYVPSYKKMVSISGWAPLGWTQASGTPISGTGYTTGNIWRFDNMINSQSFSGLYARDIGFVSGMDTKELYGDNNNDGDITDDGDTPPIQYYNSRSVTGKIEVETPSSIASVSSFNVVGWEAPDGSYVSAGEVMRGSTADIIYAAYSRSVTFYSGLNGENTYSATQTYTSDGVYSVGTPQIMGTTYSPSGWVGVTTLTDSAISNKCDYSSNCNLPYSKFYQLNIVDPIHCISGLAEEFNVDMITEYHVADPAGGKFQHKVPAISSAHSLSSIGYETLGWKKDSLADTSGGYTTGGWISNTSSFADNYYRALYRKSIEYISGVNKSDTNDIYGYYNSDGYYGIITPVMLSISGFENVGWRADTLAVNDLPVYSINVTYNDLTSPLPDKMYALYKRYAYFYSGANNTSLKNMPIQFYNTANTYSLDTPTTATEISGYTFNGWVTQGDSPNSTPIAPGATVTDSRYTYYANYTKDITIYDGLPGDDNDEYSTKIYRTGSSCLVDDVRPLMSITGYTAVGLKFGDTVSSSVDITNPSAVGDVSVSCPSVNYAHSIYSKDINFISGLHTNANQPVEKVKQYFSSNEGMSTPVTTPTGVTASQLSGYTALGWSPFETADPEFITYGFNDTIYGYEDDTYYAVYSRSATAYSGGHAASIDSETLTQYYNSSGNYSTVLPSSPGNLGSWYFYGWRDDTTATSHEISAGSSSSSSSTKFYAVYGREMYFYSGVDKEYVYDADRTQYANTYGTLSSITTPTPSSLTNWTAVGYAPEDYDTVEFNYAATVTPQFRSPNVYYAAYQRPYKITYDANGGTGSTPSNFVYYATYLTYFDTTRVKSGSFTPSTNGFTNDCHTFNGWKSSDGIIYGTGSTSINKPVNYTTSDDFGEIWYAQWEADLSCPAYAVYSDDDNSLRFYRAFTPITAGSEYNGLTVTDVYTGFETETYNYDGVPWYEHRHEISAIIFEGVISPVSTAYWFYEFTDSPSLDFSYLVTSNVTNMQGMFMFSTFETLDLIGLDTSNVTDMSYMFTECRDLLFLDLSNWNTSKVTDMSYMFYRVLNLENIIGIGNLNTSNVTNMNSMFGACISLSTIDLSNWNTSKVTDMSYMFENCTSLISVGPITSWNVSKVTDMSGMFSCCSALDLNLSSWVVSSTTRLNDFNYEASGVIIPTKSS